MSETSAVVWRDGELIPFEEATVHVLSHAAIRGSEVFDALRVLPSPEGPVAVGLRAHVARFDHSMGLIGMVSPHDLGQLEQAVAATVAANPAVTDGMVRLLAAWTGTSSATVPETLRPEVFVTMVPAPAGGPLGGEPARLQTAAMTKIPAAVLPPALKVAASYTPALRHQLAARAAGFDDVVLRAPDGGLAEGPSQSLLVVAGERVLAPPLDSVLDGITRRLVLDLAFDLGLRVEIRPVYWDEVTGADELISTSTSRFVRPVSRLDHRLLEVPGPVTAALAAEVATLIQGRHRLSARWLTPLGPPTRPTA